MLSNCPKCNSPMTSSMTGIKHLVPPKHWDRYSTPQQCVAIVKYCSCFTCHFQWEEAETDNLLNKGVITDPFPGGA